MNSTEEYLVIVHFTGMGARFGSLRFFYIDKSLLTKHINGVWESITWVDNFTDATLPAGCGIIFKASNPVMPIRPVLALPE